MSVDSHQKGREYMAGTGKINLPQLQRFCVVLSAIEFSFLGYALLVCLVEEDETEQLKASVDYLVEFCETVSPVDDSKFANKKPNVCMLILSDKQNIRPVIFHFQCNLKIVIQASSTLSTYLAATYCTVT
ncbi:protein MULTIPOLAR SPINDLE [Trifolium repens]|nr:protein MULTIPOLAR SPINDLE [Trifolium repens]